MKRITDKTVLMITTLFGVGYTPLCPGTASCVVGLAAFLLIKNMGLFFIFTVIAVIISYALSGRAEKIFKIKDCKKIVIDDFSGMLITYLFIPKRIEFIICGFFLFRMLDMIKIPPADRVEKLGGAKGIVGDDVIAGIYSNLILQIVRIFV